MAAMNGEAFMIDATNVHTFIVNLISVNKTSEAKIQAYESQDNGRICYIALKDHNKGVRFHVL